jgi:hypothetical protein
MGPSLMMAAAGHAIDPAYSQCHFGPSITSTALKISKAARQALRYS